MNTPQVTPIKTFRPKAILGLVLLFYAPLLALSQNKLLKLDKEFSFKHFPKFVLTASHNNIVISSWEKKSVSIVAYTTGNVDKQDLEKANNLWEIEIEKSDSLLILNTDASKQLPKKIITNYKVEEANPLLETDKAVVTTTLPPILASLENSTMPKELQEHIIQSKFNFEAYKNLGETYFKIWEYNLVKDLDEDATKMVRNWYRKMSNSLLSVSKNVTTTDNNNNVVYHFYERKTLPVTPIEKTIEIKLPKQTLSQLSTSFGSITILDAITNLQAKLKYTAFEAQNITGNKTNISISSAPVKIDRWSNGILRLKYVKAGIINKVANIGLHAISSKTAINALSGRGEFKSTFSHIGIHHIGNNFESLSFLNTSSDLVLSLPDQAYNFVYSGEMSGIKIPPNKLTLKSLGDYRKLMLHGYSKTRNTDKEIQMNMVNSQILLK